MRLNIALTMAALVSLSACQSAENAASPLAAETSREMMLARHAMETHCSRAWPGDADMMEYCERSQTPKMIQFVRARVAMSQVAKDNDARLWTRENARYAQCEGDHYGDFEMALACVENGRQVDRIVSRQSGK